MANYFDQFDTDQAVTADGRPSITVRPDFGRAISSIESGGNYRAVGPQTGKGRALGKYQVMDFNVGPWTQEILGRKLSPMEFLNSPEAQDAVFNAKFGGYAQKYGPEGAARAWFAGEGGMNDPNRRDVLGTSVADYGRKFVNAMGPQQAKAKESAPSTNFFDQFDGQEAQAPQEPKKKEDVGRGRAALEGYLSGISGNFSDEVYGASKASGLPEILGGFRAPVGAARLGYEYLTGQPGEATKAYEQAVAEKRAIQKAAQEQYPGTTLASEIGGAVMLPGGAALNAATLPARMGRGLAVGAAYGGVSGAGEGVDATDRASRALVGAGIGGLVGGAAVPAVEGIVRGAGILASPAINTIRGALNPDAAASRAVGRAYREAVQTDPNAVSRLTQAEVGQGRPSVVMDALGGEGRNLARSAANLSGGARDTINRTLDARYEGQSDRIVGWLNHTFNFPNANAQQQAIDQVERTVNRASYARAYRDGDRPLWSPELERLSGSPAVVDALRAASRSGQDRAINQGFGGFRSPITVGPGGTVTFNRGPNGVPTYPNLQFWDYARRELTDAASAARRSGRNEEASRFGQLATALNAELDNLVPSYQRARAGAAAFFGAENALEAGQNFVLARMANNEARRALSQMSPAERQLFQDGFVSRYIETLNSIPDRADIVRRIYNTPEARDKIQLVLGRARATELEAILRVENIMQMNLRAVQGNSTTAMQIAGLGLAGAAGAAGGGVLGFDPTASGLAFALATAGRRGIDARVAQRVAEMLTSNNPAVLNRGIRMIANSGRLMGALRSIDAAGARVGSGQVPTAISGPSVPAISRADDEPSVPRPPGQ